MTETLEKINGDGIYEFYQVMDQNEIILIYEGMFDQEMVKSVLAMTEQKLVNDDVAEVTIKKLYNIMMEGLQNICKHQMKSEGNAANSMFIISENDSSFHLVTGNLMHTVNKNIISEKIEKINSLDKEALKAYYKEARLNSVISSVGGAGLGFIDMARKSENKLNYNFHTVSEENSFFLLEVTVNKN